MTNPAGLLGRPPRIAFMTTVGHNVGDEFIREGIRSFLDEAIGDYDAYYVHKHDLSTLHRRLLDEPATLADKFRDADIIIQAGAPVYWAFGPFRCYSVDWAQELWYERILKLGPTKPILNIGAGSCQGGEHDLQPLLDDPRCAEFARAAAAACRCTTVRDPLASEFLTAIGVRHELLACPAFHAARRFGPIPAARPWLAVNLMRQAGHQVIKPQDDNRWLALCRELVAILRRGHQLLFVAHDKDEAGFQAAFVEPGETIFQAGDYRDYLSLYAGVKGIVANRVHGAVCVAGFGRPAVIIGNDSRLAIARPIGIPAIDINDATVEWTVRNLQSQFDDPDLSAKRLQLRESTARRYVEKLRDALGRENAAAAHT